MEATIQQDIPPPPSCFLTLLSPFLCIPLFLRAPPELSLPRTRPFILQPVIGCNDTVINCRIMKFRTVLILFSLLIITKEVHSKKSDKKEKPEWAKKDIRDYTDADLERLYDQWEEDDEPLEADELPEHLRPPPKIDMSNLDMKNPEDLLKLSKKGKTLMAFVSVSGNPTAQETEEITGIWQSSLMNSHINVDRYPIGENRVIFMFKDGSQAWEAKDFLVQQKRCEVVTIENKEYHGKHSSKKNKEKKDKQEL